MKKNIRIMGQIKSYTDISQSKKLAKILPIESADMYYTTNSDCEGKIIGLLDVPLYIGSDGFIDTEMGEIYAWSLASLLDIIKTYYSRLEITLRSNKNYNIFAVSGDFVFRSFDECSEGYNNIVDACVVMVEKLHEVN
jgi:hypothetical protein